MRRLALLALVASGCLLDRAIPGAGGEGPGGAGGGGAGGLGGAGGSGGATGGTGGLVGGSGGGGAAGGGGTGPCGNGVLDPGEPCDPSLPGADHCDEQCVPVPFDACPGSPVLVGDVALDIPGDSTGAFDDGTGPCGVSGTGPDVVYALRTQVGGTLALLLEGSEGQLLHVRRSCGDASYPGSLGCELGFGASVLVWAQPGETFWVWIDGATPADAGPYVLHARVYPCGNGLQELLEDCDDSSDPDCVGCVLCTGGDDFWDDDQKTRRCYREVDPPDGALRAARGDCLSRGEELATVHSTANRARFDAEVGANVWVGLTDLRAPGVHQWMDGRPLWFAPWNPGEPTLGLEHCVFVDGSGALFDYGCDWNVPRHVCEVAPIGSCGDGRAAGAEQCDDGNQVGGDGCSAECQVECDAPDALHLASGRCYHTLPASTWDQAQQACAGWGGVLVDVTSAQEQAYLEGALSGQQSWLGAKVANLFDFTWESGEDDVYQHWKPGPANETCAFMGPDGLWDRAPCADDNVKKGALCERRPAGFP